MFCLMDVSGSMTQATKDIAKRFFILLYLFLKRNYERIEVVFIRHHTSAREVDEEEFFYSRETGGTIVSSALKLMQEIMAERYPASDWNIYAAQASDGDNWNDDSPICRDILSKQIMPHVQYYTYVEITPVNTRRCGMNTSVSEMLSPTRSPSSSWYRPAISTRSSVNSSSAG